MSSIILNKIKPEFRHLVDLLFYSDRMDIDLTNFSGLLQVNREDHLIYLIDRFHKACDIYWEQGENYWSNRLTFLLSLEDKSVSKYVSRYLEQRMFSLIKKKQEINPEYDLPYLQFLEYCKVKCARQENLQSIRNYLTDLTPQINSKKLIGIINHLIPFIFKDINEYASVISKKIIQFPKNFEILRLLECQHYKFDKQPIVQLAEEIMLQRARSNKNISAFFALIDDPEVMKRLKSQYRPDYRPQLINLLSNCEYQVLEENHLKNIKNIIFLDPVVADDLAVIYADKLYARRVDHKKANADRLIRLIKMFPQISSKKILAYLSSHNKMSDIKYMLVDFPNLRKLAAFV